MTGRTLQIIISGVFSNEVWNPTGNFSCSYFVFNTIINLQINPKKINYMHLSLCKKSKDSNPNIFLDEEQLDQVRSVRFLLLIVDMVKPYGLST